MDPRSGHTQGASNESINKWNNKSTFSFLFLSLKTLIENLKERTISTGFSWKSFPQTCIHLGSYSAEPSEYSLSAISPTVRLTHLIKVTTFIHYVWRIAFHTCSVFGAPPVHPKSPNSLTLHSFPGKFGSRSMPFPPHIYDFLSELFFESIPFFPPSPTTITFCLNYFKRLGVSSPPKSDVLKSQSDTSPPE